MSINRRADERESSGVKFSVEERPRELQDWLNFRVFHPLSIRLARLLVPTPVSPNIVSIAGGLMVVAAGIVYTQSWQFAAWVGLILHLLWHVLDGADGDLARLTRRSSALGEIVDGLCDYVSHIILYIILGLWLYGQIGALAWLAMFGAGSSRILQANHFEVQRRQYQWWVYGKPWLRSYGQLGDGKASILSSVTSAYLFLGQLLAPGAAQVDKMIARASVDAQRLESARETVVSESQIVLNGLPLLGANYRTVALGVSMVAGSPIYYFAYELFLLNLILVCSIGNCRSSTNAIIAARH